MSEFVKLCVAHFNIVDGKPTLWDTPQADSIAMSFFVTPEAVVGSLNLELTDKPENMQKFFDELTDEVGVPESYRSVN